MTIGPVTAAPGAFTRLYAPADWNALEREADAAAIATAMIEAKARARSKGAELTHLVLASAIDASVKSRRVARFRPSYVARP